MGPAVGDDSPSQEELHSLLDLSSEAMWICDLRGDLRYANVAAAQLFGSSPKALIGQNVVDLGLCANGLPWERFLEALRAERELARPAAMSVPSGKTVQLMIRVRLIRLGGRELILGSGLDETERAALAAAVREREALDGFPRAAAHRLLRCSDDALLDVMREILGQLGELIGASFIGVMQRHEPEGRTERIVNWSRTPEQLLPLPEAVAREDLPMPPGFPEDRVIIARPNSSDPRATFAPAHLGVAAAVLLDQTQVLGFMGIFWADEEPFWRHLHALRALVRDIGDILTQALSRRQLRARLVAREAERKALLANLPGVAYRCRWTPEFPIEAVSENAALVFGADGEALVGASLTALIHPEDGPRVLSEAHEAALQHRRCNHTYRVLQPSGEALWVHDFGVIQRDAQGAPSHVDGILLDASEQKAVEHERDIFFNSAPDPMVILDEREIVLRWNAAWEREFGYSAADMVGQRFETFCHPDDLPGIRRAAIRQLRESGRAIGLEARFVTKSGEWRWLLWSGFFVNRGRRQTFAVARDITERRILEEERRVHAERLQQAQRLEALGVMAGGVAHDFNNLLGVAIGAMGLAQRPGVDDPERQRHLRRAQGVLERGTQLIDQLLAFGRRQVSHRAAIDLNQHVEECCALLSTLLRPNITLRLELGAQSPALADATQLEQVVMNLAVNAIDAMPDGGSLTMRTHDVTLGAADASPIGPGAYVALSVIDTGTGIEEGTRDRIFDPFFTTKPPGAGSGLGLSSCYGIVTAHGGTIRVRSAPGAGSTFEVLLPAASLSQIAVEAPSEPSPAPTSAEGSVLLVEDNTDLRELSVMILSLHGYNVTAAQDAEEAMLVLPRQRFDLLVTDVIMPGLSGVELAEIAVALWPGLPVLFVSGYAWDELVRTRRLSRDAPFLRKPYRNEELLGMVATALQRAPAA
ncbi:PAS domain S-box protein [Myxococcota bacterium]|nr:PAS domain S-box protein [Myxococcota bacterium]